MLLPGTRALPLSLAAGPCTADGRTCQVRPSCVVHCEDEDDGGQGHSQRDKARLRWTSWSPPRHCTFRRRHGSTLRPSSSSYPTQAAGRATERAIPIPQVPHTHLPRAVLRLRTTPTQPIYCTEYLRAYPSELRRYGAPDDPGKHPLDGASCVPRGWLRVRARAREEEAHDEAGSDSVQLAAGVEGSVEGGVPRAWHQYVAWAR